MQYKNPVVSEVLVRYVAVKRQTHPEYEKTPFAICRHVSMHYSQPKVQQHPCDIAAKASRIWAADPDFPLCIIVSSIHQPTGNNTPSDLRNVCALNTCEQTAVVMPSYWQT